MGFQSDTNTHWQIFPKVSAVVHSRGKFHRKQTFENFHLADIKLAPLNQQRILNILLHTSMSQQCKLNNKHNSMSQELLVVKHLHNPPLSAMPLPPPADILKHET